MPSNHLIFCHPLLLLPSIFPIIMVFSNELGLPIRWPKYRRFSFSISLSNEYSGLISFWIDWFDPAIQGTLKSFLRHYSSKASILRCSAFFMVQLPHLYMTTGKTIALTLQTSVSKVMSVLFNTLSSFLIAFLPRSKRFLISWLQSLSTVILEPKKIKPVTVSTFSPSICLHLCPCKPSGCPGALGTWVLATWLSSAALAPPRLLSDPRDSQAQEKEICSVH